MQSNSVHKNQWPLDSVRGPQPADRWPRAFFPRYPPAFYPNVISRGHLSQTRPQSPPPLSIPWPFWLFSLHSSLPDLNSCLKSVFPPAMQGNDLFCFVQRQLPACSRRSVSTCWVTAELVPYPSVRVTHQCTWLPDLRPAPWGLRTQPPPTQSSLSLRLSLRSLFMSPSSSLCLSSLPLSSSLLPHPPFLSFPPSLPLFEICRGNSAGQHSLHPNPGPSSVAPPGPLRSNTFSPGLSQNTAEKTGGGRAAAALRTHPASTKSQPRFLQEADKTEPFSAGWQHPLSPASCLGPPSLCSKTGFSVLTW